MYMNIGVKRSIMSFYIGKTKLKHGIMLAPMAGVTDNSFRAMCKRFGAEYTLSEMVCAKAMCYEQRKKTGSESKSGLLATVKKEELPLAVQIFGSEPEFMAEAASMIENRSYLGCISDVAPSAIDINMGCPVKKITANGEGSALMKNPELCEKIVEAVVKATSLPVTVKIRAGWDKDTVNAVEVAKTVESAGAQAICVHARTKEQMYLPGVDLSVIADVKNAVKIPVIGNGDIYSAADAKRMISETGCDGIMVARGALGNPWIFSEIKAALENDEYEEPTAPERLLAAKELLSMMIIDKGERIGCAEAKKQIAWFIRDIPCAAASRSNVMTAQSSTQIHEILDELISCN